MSGILLPYQRRWIEDKCRFKIWLASRQIGKSFATALEGVDDGMERRTSWVYLSRGERQSKELAEKAKTHIDAYRVAAEALEDDFFLGDGSKVTQLEYRLPNGSRHIFLPANPDTARGYTANVVLDEFAFHKDSRAIWTALYPSITRNPSLKIRVISTPNGKVGKFFELWDESRDEASVWSRHRTDIYDAVADGLDIDPEELRAGLKDELAWQQEYELQFLEETTAYLNYELISSCEDAGATIDGVTRELLTGGDVYLGFDVGRRRDLSVIWLLEKVGDVYWTRRVILLRNTPFSVQREVLYDLLPLVRRACIDETGIGMQLAEEAREKFGYKIEGVTFTNAVKSDLATTMRRGFEDKTVRIPIERDIRDDLHSVRRIVTSAGNIRFDAEADANGHADRFWALALALHAAVDTPKQNIYA
jgi:phage FluMu gp28-like protein